MRLHEALDGGSRGLALLTYQHATLLFIRGRLPEAAAVAARSLRLAEAAFASERDQVFPFKSPSNSLFADQRTCSAPVHGTPFCVVAGDLGIPRCSLCLVDGRTTYPGVLAQGYGCVASALQGLCGRSPTQ